MRQCPPHTLEFLPEAKARESPHRAGLVGSQSCAERGERVAAIVRLVDNADGGEDSESEAGCALVTLASDATSWPASPKWSARPSTAAVYIIWAIQPPANRRCMAAAASARSVWSRGIFPSQNALSMEVYAYSQQIESEARSFEAACPRLPVKRPPIYV